MPQHEIKTCQRCGNSFECKVGNITQCQCFTVPLSQAEREYMMSQYEDCLCAECMKAVKEEFNELKIENGELRMNK